jgi:hypothetical protein
LAEAEHHIPMVVTLVLLVLLLLVVDMVEQIIVEQHKLLRVDLVAVAEHEEI